MRNRKKTEVPRIERAGAWLLEAHRSRATFAPLPAELAPILSFPKQASAK